MSRALIAGCGYLGTAAARLFLENGWQVTAWSRSGEIADEKLAGSVRVEPVDLSNADDVRRHSFVSDLVLHCASTGGGDAGEYRRVYREGVRNLLASFPATRLIFTSSTSVYAQRDGSWVDEDSPAEPASETAKVLRETEELVLSANGTVLRLGGIYGPNRSFLLNAVLQGKLRRGGPDRFVNQIHRDDAASAIYLAAKGQRRRILNVVDDAPTLRSEILNWIAVELKRPLPEFAESASSKRGTSNKRVRNAKLRSLGWAAKFPSYKEGFLNSVFRQAGTRALQTRA